MSELKGISCGRSKDQWALLELPVTFTHLVAEHSLLTFNQLYDITDPLSITIKVMLMRVEGYCFVLYKLNYLLIGKQGWVTPYLC